MTSLTMNVRDLMRFDSKSVNTQNVISQMTSHGFPDLWPHVDSTSLAAAFSAQNSNDSRLQQGGCGASSAQSTQDFNATHFTNLAQQFSSQFPLNFPSSISTSGNDGASGIAPFANSMRSASGFHSNPLTSNYFQQNQNSGSGLLSSGNLQSRAAGIAACLSSASVSSSFPNKLHSETAQIPTASIEEKLEGSGPSHQIMCQVCFTAPSNGLHFGAKTCAACAAFFRRTISDGKKYVCKRSQRCTLKITDSTGYRKICRNCRMKRCLDIGMLPENVQNKRHRREDQLIAQAQQRERAPSDSGSNFSLPKATIDYTTMMRTSHMGNVRLDHLGTGLPQFSNSPAIH
uniref:Nuclear receptor domain-containing protein n=1 Tax=Acrobeloides nanus TaxID=290746 RepID=A0A914BVG9_9BILA